MNAGHQQDFWSRPVADLLKEVSSSESGLTQADAEERLARFSAQQSIRSTAPGNLRLLLKQVTSPIMLLLIAAVVLSYFLHDPADALIILAIVTVSSALGFFQEHKAARALAELLAIVQVDVQVVRNGAAVDIPQQNVVPGDVAILRAGDVVPGDCRLLESKDLFVDESALTGETYPAEKITGDLSPATSLNRRSNCLWMGTHVVSGTARALVMATGRTTVFGAISQKLRLRAPETDFEAGVRHFGYFLLEITLVMTLVIFASNVFLQRPVLDSFLFALALAVGLTPQLLPAIISVNLAQGARRMAARQVIVKRLDAIENFGSMDVFCCDKTGTITEGKVRLTSARDTLGNESPQVLQSAILNASMQSGYANALDLAIVAMGDSSAGDWCKLDEIPYDFTRRRMTLLVQKRGDAASKRMITKGAFANVLEVCSSVHLPDGTTAPMQAARDSLVQQFETMTRGGFRVLALAERSFAGETVQRSEETAMLFTGFLLFTDPLRSDAGVTLSNLKQLGISMKIITGDNALLAAQVSEAAGMHQPRVLTGTQLKEAGEHTLRARVTDVDVFAEMEPEQKEQIILAMRRAGHVVGYMGDGINDAPALHAADVSISVSNAVDVAKEAADIVLLSKDLAVLERGVRDGRATFANTLKYVFMATSANFGNMFSMAGASLFLPFLPLLPKQILLTNLLADFPEMTIATDKVDRELVDKPRRWNFKQIRSFMLVFGLLSSVFDYCTFAVLLLLLHSGMEEFRTGWFVESVISASFIVLVVRTRRPFLKSKPSGALLGTTMAVWAVTVALPFTPLAGWLGLAPLSLPTLLILFAIVASYITAAELIKGCFYRKLERGG